MQRSRPRYSPEFRQQMVPLVRSGRTPESLSREFEPSAQSIRNWVEQSDRDAGDMVMLSHGAAADPASDAENPCGPHKNCTELRKDHPRGVPKGHCAYQSRMDRDKDGWACEH